jgi:hypothetical protein
MRNTNYTLHKSLKIYDLLEAKYNIYPLMI